MTRIAQKLLLSGLALNFTLTAQAEIELPRLIGSNMVLQQETSNTLWGWVEPGARVNIKASWGASATGTADENGKWSALLETPGHGTGYSLTFTCGADTVEIKNVAIGEVWLCAGQSNMGWALGNCFGGEAEAASADAPNFRIFKSSREHWHEPLEQPRDQLAKWSTCNPQSAAATSAVSYYFGKKLHNELDIPVGIIVQAFAGTPIEGWMPKEIQLDDPRTLAGIAQIQRLSRRFDRDESLARFKRELAEYNALIASGETMLNKVKQLSPPIITKPANLGHQCPAHIFNAMIYPIRPYGIRGAIWYQGERNSKDIPQAVNYRKQLAQLIGYYRSSWHELSGGNVSDDFPFYFTQLPSWNPPQAQPVEGLEASWAVNREMMRLVASEVHNTGMVVSIDTGDAIALHPRNKKPIGLRHAYLALADTYGKEIVGSGPRFLAHHIDGDRITILFDSTGNGLVPARDAPLDAFAIAGEDKQWHWATAEIQRDTIVLSSPNVKQPVAARYAWAMNPSQRNLLYNKEGLPASPFRTDDWQLFNPDDEIVTVNKPKKPEGYAATDWDRPPTNQ